jgi:hypothetical protein
MFQLGKPSSQKTYSEKILFICRPVRALVALMGIGAPLSVEETKILEEIYLR